MGRTLAKLTTTAAGAAAVTSAEVKSHLRIDTGFTADDSWITDQIAATQAELEQRSGLAFTQTTFELYLSVREWWPSYQLPKGNILAVSQVAYIAAATTDGSYTVLNATQYRVLLGRPGVVQPRGDVTLPDLHAWELWPLKITFNAGFSAVPGAIKSAMLCRIEQRSRDRSGVEGKFPFQIDCLLSGYAEWMGDLIYVAG